MRAASLNPTFASGALLVGVVVLSLSTLYLWHLVGTLTKAVSRLDPVDRLRVPPPAAINVPHVPLGSSLSPAGSGSSSSSGADSVNALNALRYVRAFPHLMFFYNLHDHERKIYSQEGTDGVLEYVFAHLTPRDKYYVEFGTESCSECVSKHLWERYGWDGLLLDGSGKTGDSRVIHNHYLRSDNIVDLFRKYKVPEKFDYLSVDIDRNDYYVAKAIFEGGYKPQFLSLEVNRNFELLESYAIKLDDDIMWDHSARFGQSPLAAARLMNRFGYQMVGYDKHGVNCFFVRRGRVVEYLREKTGFDYTEEEVQMLLPQYEYVYSPHQELHIGSIKEFKEKFDAKDWNVIGPDGVPV